MRNHLGMHLGWRSLKLNSQNDFTERSYFSSKENNIYLVEILELRVINIGIFADKISIESGL